MRGPWDGDRGINAGWRYSSGTAHFSWDVATPMGTALYAIGEGVIVDCNDGVKDQPPDRPAGSGAPSNWIILKFIFPKASKYAGKTGFAYYQHLKQGGVNVKKGQKVARGDLIGRSGNSGNSSGPHLHLTVLKPGHTMNAGTRYAYLNNPSMVVWEPKAAWGDANYGVYEVYVDKLRPGVDNSKSVRKLRRALIKRGFLSVSKPLGLDKPGDKYTPAVSEAVKKWQRKHDHTPDGTLSFAQAKQFFSGNERVKVVK